MRQFRWALVGALIGGTAGAVPAFITLRSVAFDANGRTVNIEYDRDASRRVRLSDASGATLWCVYNRLLRGRYRAKDAPARLSADEVGTLRQLAASFKGPATKAFAAILSTYSPQTATADDTGDLLKSLSATTRALSKEATVDFVETTKKDGKESVEKGQEIVAPYSLCASSDYSYSETVMDLGKATYEGVVGDVAKAVAGWSRRQGGDRREAAPPPADASTALAPVDHRDTF